MKNLLIIDTFALIFRAYHAYPADLTARDGTPTNAIFGILQMVMSIVEKYEPDCIVFALESRTKTFREEMYEAYKANRKEPDENIKIQIEIIIKILRDLDVLCLSVDGYEADDVIGSIVNKYASKYKKIEILTGDRDLLQLIRKNVFVLLPGFVFSQIKIYNEKEFVKKYDVKVEDYVFYKALIGDTSDNIKGIPGIGPKTAVKVINQFNDTEKLFANLDSIDPRIASKLENELDNLRTYVELSKVYLDLDIELDESKCRTNKMNVNKLRDIVQKYEFKSIGPKTAKFIDFFNKKYGENNLFADLEEEFKLDYKIVDRVQYDSN